VPLSSSNMPPHFTPTSDEGLRGRSGENGMLQGKIPVAVMGDGAQSTAAKAGGASQPVLYVEFRKNGFPSIQARGGPQTKARRFADIMRKTSLILLGAVAGVAVTLIVRRCSQIR